MNLHYPDNFVAARVGKENIGVLLTGMYPNFLYKSRLEEHLDIPIMNRQSYYISEPG